MGERVQYENHRYDVFVSYAHADNEKPLGSAAQYGWVTTLAHNLNTGPGHYRKNLFIDHRLKPGDVFSDDLVMTVGNSTLLLLLLSQNYIDSRWCGDELDHFVRIHANNPDKPADVFVVELAPFHILVNVPANIQKLRERLIHAQFWYRPAGASAPQLAGYPTPQESGPEGEHRYWLVLDELRNAIDSRLRDSRSALRSGQPISTAAKEAVVVCDIFISYTSEDRDRVRSLAQALERQGWSVWWDRRIPAGRSFDEVIEEALNASKAVVVVWTTTSVKSSWVKNVAREGLRRRVLFPVRLLEEVEIPLEFEHIQVAQLMDWQLGKAHSGFDQFVEDIAQVVGPPSEADVQQTSLNQSKGKPLTQREPASDMVKVPKGPFLYGVDKTRETIDYDYWIDKYPVTNKKYQAFIEAGGYENQQYWSPDGWRWKTLNDITGPEYWNNEQWNKHDYPVVGVSYYEAEAYSKWAGKRLPTEQEWEKAARGNSGRQYPWGEEFDKNRCNSFESGIRHTTPVTQYRSGVSPYGCYDMAGNVWEWCSSWYHESLGRRVTRGGERVIRGGSWDVSPGLLRVSFRFRFDVGDRNDIIGFRLAQDLP
ncbi:MAG: TIR domain-containing protein [Nitrospira sp. LK70]|nr:TIR domain-containing protein [Nitrospira sp. LK70]